MSIPKHLLDAKICNEETCKLSNTIPNDKNLLNMVAHLVVENANMQRKINKIKEYAGDLRLYDNESLEFKISDNLLNILQNGSEKNG